MFKVGDYVRTTKEWNIYWNHVTVEGPIVEILEETRRVIKNSCDKFGCGAFLSFEVTDEFETVQLIKLEEYDGMIYQEDLIKDEKETLIQRILRNARISSFNDAYDNIVNVSQGVDFSLAEIENGRRRFKGVTI